MINRSIYIFFILLILYGVVECDISYNIICTTTILCNEVNTSCNGLCNNCTKCEGIHCMSCVVLYISNITSNPYINCGCNNEIICQQDNNNTPNNDYITLIIFFVSIIVIFLLITCIFIFSRPNIYIPVIQKFHNHVNEPHYDTFHQIPQ